MKRFNVITILLLFVVFNSFSQSAYYDARALQNKFVQGKLTKDSVAGFVAVLKKYLPESLKTQPDGTPTPDISILNSLSNSESDYYNPFVKKLKIADWATKNLAPDQATAEAAPGLTAATPAGLTTMMIDGMAKFLVKRTKEELSSVFFDDFEKLLNDQKDLQKFFPSTFTILHTAKDEIYSYQVYLPALQEAFKNDLDNLLANAYTWTKSTDGALIQDVQKDPRLYAALKTAFYMARELDKGTHPADLLNTLVKLNRATPRPAADSIDFAAIHPNLFPSLQTINVFSQSLRTDVAGRYWITEEEFKVFRSETFTYLYFALIYQQIHIDKKTSLINFTTADNAVIRLDQVLEKMASNIGQLTDALSKIKEQLTTIETQVNTILNSKDRKVSSYVTLAQTLATSVERVSGSPFAANASRIDKAAAQFYVDHLSALWSYIESKAYNSAVFEAYVVLDAALGEKADGALTEFLKYGNFMAAVAAAQNSGRGGCGNRSRGASAGQLFHQAQS